MLSAALLIAQGLPHADRAAVAQHARASIEASRAVRDPHDIRRMLADGRNQLERLKNTLWMAK